MSKRKFWPRRSPARAELNPRDSLPLRRRRRLLVERLAERRVLAAISGEVFEDVNFSLRREGGEPALESRVLYLDANQNAALDDGESIALSDASGQFTFSNLSDGTYLVRLFDGSTTQQQTFPIQAENQGPGLGVANGSDIIHLGQSVAIVSGGNIHVGNTAIGLSADVRVADQLADAVKMPDGTLLAIGNELGGQGVWLINPAGRDVRETDFMFGDQSADDGATEWSRIVIDQSGRGFLLGTDGNDGVLRSIDASDASAGLQVTESTTVPIDTQLLSSSVGPRSILAWAGNGGLELSIWSNGGSQIGMHSVTLPGATELIDFDDARGLLAVRTDEGDVSVLDVDGNFATLQTFSDVGDNVLLDGERELLVSLSSANQTVDVLDIRDGSTLTRLNVDLSSVGSVAAIASGDSPFSLLVLGSSGVTNVSLLTPGSHRVEVGDDGSSSPIRFGVNVSGDNTPPAYLTAPTFSTAEDTVLNTSPPGALTTASDADGDTIILLQSGPSGHGVAVVSVRGGVRYEPAQDFYGDDAIPVTLHDGRDPSEVTMIQVSVEPTPDPPTVISPPNPLPEDAQPGDVIGPLVITDPDGFSDDLTISIDSDLFDIIGDEIVYVGGPLDFETESEAIVPIEIFDEEFSEEAVEQVITVTIGDVNEPITDIFDVFENAIVDENVEGAYITTFEVEDEDAGDTHTLSVDDNRFVFRGFDLYLADGVFFDFEQTPLIPINVTAVDGAGHSLTLGFTVEVFDVPEQPQTIELGGDSVVEFVPGDVVGDVMVDGVEVGSGYTVVVDDSRFEIVDSTLKLVDTQFVELATQSEIELTITAQDSEGFFGAVSETFIIDILVNDTPFHNDSLPYDVNRSGDVSPADALAIINYLNAYGPGPVGSGNPSYGYDVNADLYVTPLDALLVLNYLNLPGNSGTVNGEGGEGEPGGDGGEGEQVPDGQSPATPRIRRRFDSIASIGTRPQVRATTSSVALPRPRRFTEAIPTRWARAPLATRPSYLSLAWPSSMTRTKSQVPTNSPWMTCCECFRTRTFSGAAENLSRRRPFRRSLLCEQFLLVSALRDVNDDQHGQDEVKRTLGHRGHVMAEELQLGQVSALADQHDTDDEQDEQAEHFIHPVLL